MRYYTTKKGRVTGHTLEFDSMHDYVTANRAVRGYVLGPGSGDRSYIEEFHGEGAETNEKAYALALGGLAWKDLHPTDIRGHLGTTGVDLPLDAWEFDVSGSFVDVDRYLSGEPECMVDYVTAERPERVVTIVSSIQTTWRVTAEQMTRRGEAVVAMILGIESLGVQTELWAESVIWSDPDKGDYARIRVRVKSAGEVADPSTILFAFSHPAMLRILGFNAYHHLPKHLHRLFTLGNGYGYVRDHVVRDDYPESAVILPAIGVKHDDDHVETLIPKTLAALGLA